MRDSLNSPDTHQALIEGQFTQQAELFANASALHNACFFADLFRKSGMPMPTKSFYQVPVEMEALLKTSFPAGNDRDGVRKLLRDAIAGDRMGFNLRRQGDTIHLEYPAAILFSTKPDRCPLSGG